MVQGGMSCIKYLMFVFNFIFVICGIVLIIIGAIVQRSDLTVFLDTKFVTGPVILIIVGCVVFFIAFLGCTGAVKENRCMVTLFGLLLFVIFIVEIAGGISAYVHKDELQDILKKGMNDSIEQGKGDAMTAWDEMQSKLKCCGVDGAQDWVVAKGMVPPSCCNPQEPTCNTESAFKPGCYPKMLDTLKSKLTLVGGVGIGVGVIELLGCMMAWCLASAIRKEYEGV